jgi:hypothetical protein
LPLFPVFMDALQLATPSRDSQPGRRTKRIADRARRADSLRF